MTSNSTTPEDYLKELPEVRKQVVSKIRDIINKNLPTGFEEGMGYGMISYHIPHSLYPDGYHCSPKLPLPFMNIASQKNFVAIYHAAIHSDKDLLNWFKIEYPKHCSNKLDMGKSCIRFKNIKKIPYQLIGELVAKITVAQWIKIYESVLVK